MTFHLLNLFDTMLLAVITLIAYDALRQLHAFRHPARALCFVFMAIGSFGWIMFDTCDIIVPWWALMLHAGFAMHAVIRFHARNHGEDHVGLYRNDRQLVAGPVRQPPERQAGPGPERGYVRRGARSRGEPE